MKSKRNKGELAVASKTRKVSTFMNRLENQRNYKTQNMLNQNHIQSKIEILFQGQLLHSTAKH